MKKTIKNTLLAFVFLFFGACQVWGQKFTIPVFPDTQVEIGDKPEMYFSQIDWIISKKDSLNIPFVLHVGDLVNFDNYEHYEVASQGLDKLDRHRIPYAIALGNHDTEAVGEYSGSAAPGNVNQNLRKTAKFNAYFPANRFINQRGRYEQGKSDNAYYTFKVGNTNWLVINLEFCLRLGAINWAGDIIKQYHAYNVILLTHYYLTPKGEVGETNAGYGDFSPKDILDNLVKRYENIKFVLSGHVVSSAYRVEKLENGNTVYQILQDYQHEDSGGGYLRLLTFDIDRSTVSAKMYSPFYHQTKQDSSSFSFQGVNFLKVRR